MFTKTIISKFKDLVEKENLITNNDNIIVGASGGPDSQFLIYLLYELKRDINFNIILAHLNHLHRKDAYNDEKLVETTGKKLNMEFHLKRKSMDDFAKDNKLSPEDAGRILRYEFFDSLRKNYKNSKIAVAHNKDDLAETVLMRIIRGTGFDGLIAMDYKNNHIIRPILDFRKKDILRFLDENKIPYHIDYTNFQTDYRRNKIRLEIMPEIEKINPKFIDSLVNLSDFAKDNKEILKDYEEDIYKNLIKIKDNYRISFYGKNFEDIKIPMKKRILRRAIKDILGNVKDFSRENIEDFLKVFYLDVGKSIEKDRIIFQKNYKTYDLYKKELAKKIGERSYLYENSSIKFFSYQIKGKVISLKEYNRINKKNKFFYDNDSIKYPLKVRFRENGDYFTAFSDGRSKKLKDFFIDQKIDRIKRDKIPLILNDENIILIGNLRRSEDFKVSDKSKEVLMIEVEEIWEKILMK